CWSTRSRRDKTAGSTLSETNTAEGVLQKAVVEQDLVHADGATRWRAMLYIISGSVPAGGRGEVIGDLGNDAVARGTLVRQVKDGGSH
ncbi:MAG: hypothetical protein WCA23_06050, partial [Stellaceae bacterium]